MKIKLGFSSCPNDTFIFDALVNQKIDTEDLDFDIKITDVEELNRWALEEVLHVTKISCSAFTHCVKFYSLLESGSALGRHCGPILVKKQDTSLNHHSIIAIPGKFTTANMLFSLAYPKYINKKEFLFSSIEDARNNYN